MVYQRQFADGGGLMSYGASVPGLYQRGAYYIHRIVLGEKPTDIPALWNAPMTTVADRKDSVRQLIDRIVVDAQGASEHVQLAF